MMTQNDYSLTADLAAKAGLSREAAHRVAIEAQVRSCSGEWGTVVWWREGHEEITPAMPRHSDGEGGWRFTTRAGWELFVPLGDIITFDPEGAS